jgi:ABC-type polysaccharide/polyol phosphate export permease
MMSELRELWRFRELLVTLVQRDLKIRYKNSALGFFWSLLNPLLIVLVMTFILSNFMGMKISSPSAYIMAAYLPFIFFQLCLMDSAQTILASMPLIRKIYFPREVLPLASVISNFIHFVLAMGVLFAFLIAVYWLNPGSAGERQWPIQIGIVWLPVLFVINFALSLGLSFYISALNTFYEDVKYLVGVTMQLLFFACPIMYFIEQVGNSALNQRLHGIVYQLYQLNPIAELCIAYRKLLLAPIGIPAGIDPATKQAVFAPSYPFDWRYLGVAALLSFAILISGYATFNRVKWKFVERP